MKRLPRNCRTVDRNKLRGLIGLTKKSGNLIVGTELTVAELRKDHKTPYLVLLASDASDNTVKRIRNGCAFHKRPLEVLPLAAEELGLLVGKKGAVACVSVINEGLARAIAENVRDGNNDSKQREDQIW